MQTLTAGGSALRVDVTPYFSDPDGDTLGYSVVSSDAAVVSASISGSIVVLSPVKAGAAVATVTATDSGGLSARQPIVVTVRPGDIPVGGAAPDLIVESPEVSSSAVVPEASFTLSATVRNQGAARSASTTLRYYRSSDSTISTGDTEVGTDSVSGLSGGGSGLESVRLTAPASSGTYYYGACVEPVSGESEPGNNCSAGVTLTVTSAPVPDLVVESPEVSSSAVVLEASFTLSATVRNQGVGRSASTTLRYYRSSDSTISTGDTEVGTDSVFGLSGGGSGLESIRLTAPTSPGTYYYGACVEPVSGESEPGNNCSAGVTLTVTSAPVPDLVVEAPEVSSGTVVPEGSFTLSTTVRNQGAGRSDSTTLHYYRSADSTISTSDTEVGTDFVSRLTGGGSGLESIRLTAPVSPGTYYYGACVEPVSGESDTGNNCSAGVPLAVETGAGPDLVVESPEVSSNTVVPEASFTLSATVRNQGAGRSDSTTLHYYRSPDSTISTSDTEVGTDFVSRLTGGASGLESIRLTAPVSPGTYYYGACVEPVSGESDTGNNCSAGVPLTVTSAPVPDLVVESPEVSTSAVVPEASFTLSATVRNQGAGRSASTTLRYYRSSDSTISTGDTEVGTDSVFGLSGGGSGLESIRLTAPTSPGTYYYGACVEPVSEESEPGNNCSAGVPLTVTLAPVPDLVAESPEVSSSAVVPEASFTLSATVRNQGAGRSDSTTLRYYRSSDSTISTSDTEVGTDSVFGLSGGGSGLESIRLTAPTSPGTYYYGACVEPVSGESEPGNNCSAGVTLTVTSAPVPDLVVEAPEVSSGTVVPEGSFTLSTTVRNQGAGRSDSTTLHYYRSADSTISTSDTEVGTDFVSRLTGGGSGLESIRLTAPVSPGTYYYGACVEPVSGESDTGNNCSAGVPLAVETGAGPDLVVESPEVSSNTVVPEASFTLSATVRNQGAGRSDSTTLHYYRSPDSTISTSDTEVGTDFVSRLTGGGSGLESIRLTAPVSPGTYYYGACVEPVSGESDTGNNCSAGVPLTVTSAPVPDLVVESPEVSTSAVVPEASFTLSATVRNQGAGRSASTTLRYYRSSDSTISTGDTEVGTDSVFGLSGGGSGLESIRLTAPTSPGTYYYGACVEPVSEESEPGNNCSAGVPLTVTLAPVPDLVAESPEVSSSAVVPEASFTLSATVRNQGAGRSDSTTLRYYRSSDSTISTSDTEVGTDSVFGLSGGGSGLESIRLTAPVSPGTYYYGACVEPVSGESDTGNNCSTAVSLTVESGGGTAPDLIVASPALSSGTVVPGAVFTLSATVQNQGAEQSASTTLRYYRSSDATISTSDLEVGTDFVPVLPSGVGWAESIRLTAPGSPGTHYYGACVEPVSEESDTGNNCSAGVSLTVESVGGTPDLVAESPEVSRAMVVPDGFFTLSATVRNRGSGLSGSTTVRYYRSSDSTISTSDTEVETISLEALAAGGSVTASTLVRAPSSNGTYYYGACVDAVNGESDTGNNCSAGVRVEVGSTGPACTVGQLLSPGEFCTVVIPGFSLTDNRFRVTSDGRGCYEILCVDGSLSLNGFVATKQSDGRWRIDALP